MLRAKGNLRAVAAGGPKAAKESGFGDGHPGSAQLFIPAGSDFENDLLLPEVTEYLVRSGGAVDPVEQAAKEAEEAARKAEEALAVAKAAEAAAAAKRAAAAKAQRAEDRADARAEQREDDLAEDRAASRPKSSATHRKG